MLPGAQPISVVTMADDSFVRPLAVLGQSLVEHLPSGQRIELYVIDGGITATSKEHLRASWDADRIHATFVVPQFGEQVLPVWGRFPPLTYARVFLGELLPADCDKVILLDSDIVVLADIQSLWDMDLEDKSLLAAQDPAVPFVSSPDGLAHYRSLGVAPDRPYFNAGVMVVNLAKWRRTKVQERVVKFTQQHADELNYCDQEGLNAILWNDWGALDCRWQVQPRLMGRLPLPHLDARQRSAMTEDPWLLHFTGRLKPWVYRSNTPADRIFYRYLDQTWWKNWRPPHTIQAWLYRLYDSPLRDCIYPMERWANACVRNLTRRSATATAEDRRSC